MLKHKISCKLVVISHVLHVSRAFVVPQRGNLLHMLEIASHGARCVLPPGAVANPRHPGALEHFFFLSILDFFFSSSSLLSAAQVGVPGAVQDVVRPGAALQHAGESLRGRGHGDGRVSDRTRRRHQRQDQSRVSYLPGQLRSEGTRGVGVMLPPHIKVVEIKNGSCAQMFRYMNGLILPFLCFCLISGAKAPSVINLLMCCTRSCFRTLEWGLLTF